MAACMHAGFTLVSAHDTLQTPLSNTHCQRQRRDSRDLKVQVKVIYVHDIRTGISCGMRCGVDGFMEFRNGRGQGNLRESPPTGNL